MPISSSEPSERSRSAVDRWIVAGFALLFLGMLAADFVIRFEPAKASVAFFVIFWALLVLVHELGHAVVAQVLGWRVCAIVVGFGRTIGRFRLGSMEVEIRLIPIQGFVIPAPRTLDHVRLKSALIYFAGPGVELVLLLALVASVGPATLLRPTENIGLIALQTLAATILIGVFFTLVPMKVRTSGGEALSDGMGILLSPFLPSQHFENALVVPFLYGAQPHLERRDFQGALGVYRSGLEEFPHNASLLVASSEVLTELDRFAEAREMLLTVVDRDDLDPLARAELCDRLAQIDLVTGDAALLDEADARSRQAAELAPSNPANRVARGGALIEQRRFHEAVPMLKAIAEALVEPEDRAACDCWLALADFRRGNRRDAFLLLESLEQQGIEGKLYERVAREMRAH